MSLVKVGELKVIESSLSKLAASDLPIKFSWKLSKFIRQIQEEFKILEEQRVKLVSKYASEEDKNRVAESNIDAFINEYNDLLSVEIDVSYPTISINDLPDTLQMTPTELASLDNKIILD